MTTVSGAWAYQAFAWLGGFPCIRGMAVAMTEMKLPGNFGTNP